MVDHASEIQFLNCRKLAIIWKDFNYIAIYWHDVIVNFFDVAMFLLPSLVTGPSFMSISLLVLGLWQLSFIKDWPDIRKLEIPLSEFWAISGYWGELRIPNLARMSAIKSYWIFKVPGLEFRVSELSRKNQQWRWWLRSLLYVWKVIWSSDSFK